MKRAAEDGPGGSPKEKRTNTGECSSEPKVEENSSLPQYRLGTIASKEELDLKVEEFAKQRLIFIQFILKKSVMHIFI